MVGYAHRRGVLDPVEVVLTGDADSALAGALLAALGNVAERGIWTEDERVLAAAGGLGIVRSVVRLARNLPLDFESAPAPDGVIIIRGMGEAEVGPFLVVHRAAFADHPDNTDWGPSDVAERMTREWFEPGGVLMAWWRGRPVGVCWTKRRGPSIGEIYEIAIHPVMQRKRLGPCLVSRGLTLLAEGGATEAIVWTETDNENALRLYERLGFAPVATRSLLGG